MPPLTVALKLFHLPLVSALLVTIFFLLSSHDALGIQSKDTSLVNLLERDGASCAEFMVEGPARLPPQFQYGPCPPRYDLQGAALYRKVCLQRRVTYQGMKGLIFYYDSDATQQDQSAGPEACTFAREQLVMALERIQKTTS